MPLSMSRRGVSSCLPDGVVEDRRFLTGFLRGLHGWPKAGDDFQLLKQLKKCLFSWEIKNPHFRGPIFQLEFWRTGGSWWWLGRLPDPRLWHEVCFKFLQIPNGWIWAEIWPLLYYGKFWHFCLIFWPSPIYIFFWHIWFGKPRSSTGPSVAVDSRGFIIVHKVVLVISL